MEQQLHTADPKTYSPLTLAFLGDVVYELMVREKLVAQGSRPAGELHRLAVGMVSATAQASVYPAVEALLNEKELAILKRGRNANSTKAPKSCTVDEYRKATALETLFGYLYMEGQIERVRELYQVMESSLNTIGE
ncbi:ribonuclease III domain-containing protein [Oscillospiraceae bacterium MB08-C2-2]|nr:ribonuclease III domain-containing protein [Oscillospiraceae bacterium MB08-C2-2]